MPKYKWFVACKNTLGQPSITPFESKEEFEEHNNSPMEDGSGRLVKDAYPIILYQGPDEDACQCAWDKEFEKVSSDPTVLGGCGVEEIKMTGYRVVNGYTIEPGVNLEGIDFEGADLKWVNLEGARLYNAKLEGANLTGANLEGANLIEANLKGACLVGADITGAKLRGANLEGMVIDDGEGERYVLKG